MAADAGGLTLELKRVLPAGASVAFAAFTDPGRLARWWGPRGFSVPSLELESRVGARYRIHMQPPEGDPFDLVGEFIDVDPPQLLAFTFAWEDPDPDDVETLAELPYRDLGHPSEDMLTQGPFKTEARRGLHRGGW